MKTHLICLLLYYLFAQSMVLEARTVPSDTSKITNELRQGNERLINPLLDCGEMEHSKLRDMVELERLIQKEVAKNLATKNVLKLSVYYRELNNGTWIGVNENEKYTPASLLKLPILIAALKQAEVDQTFLQRKAITESEKQDYIQTMGNNGFVLPVGRTYTMEELLEIMIVFSNNSAKDLIIKNIDPKFLDNVFYELGIDVFRYKNFEYCISPKEYATYFRVLYNASYLTKEHSQYALELLSRTRFKAGLSGGIRHDVIVAHKFGERDFDDLSYKQLHDCGIVYLKDKPYIICVMVIGKEYTKIGTIILEISKLVFEFIDRTNNNVQAGTKHSTSKE